MDATLRTNTEMIKTVYDRRRTRSAKQVVACHVEWL
jgi:hypothetical protein|tara:strand:- start:595 stop:702 length:108 start_codon:yes stop_codon:yes gene_type:complete